MNDADSLVNIRTHRHTGTPKQRQKHTRNLELTQLCYIGFGIGFKELNASRPSEHPPGKGGKCQNVLGGTIGCKDKTSS